MFADVVACGGFDALDIQRPPDPSIPSTITKCSDCSFRQPVLVDDPRAGVPQRLGLQNPSLECQSLAVVGDETELNL